MGGSKLNKPEIKQHVVQRLASGATHTEIAREVEIDRSAVTRFSHKPEIRELVQQEGLRLVEILPDAVQAVMDTVKSYKNIPNDDLKQREFAYKVIRDVMKTFRIYPTPFQSQTIVNIQQADNGVIAPDVLKVLKVFFDSEHEGYIDVDLGLQITE